MAEEKTPQTSETECHTVGSPEFEDEECWFYNGLAISFCMFKPKRPSSRCLSILPPFALLLYFSFTDDDMETQEDKSLGYTESFRCLQDILHENKINSIDDSNTRQAGLAISSCNTTLDNCSKTIVGRSQSSNQ
ncbi:testis-specific protein TSX-like [Chionomys nivalis]|uniref:testis-specific protein TSX-like n=1 Tax=Chionomys nivalis TaxID=269649 RepID=UPI0025942C84|nr:testis-specific protein TSX-like [Chionomys nivalis]